MKHKKKPPRSERAPIEIEEMRTLCANLCCCRPKLDRNRGALSADCRARAANARCMILAFMWGGPWNRKCATKLGWYCTSSASVKIEWEGNNWDVESHSADFTVDEISRMEDAFLALILLRALGTCGALSEVRHADRRPPSALLSPLPSTSPLTPAPKDSAYK